jgi:hypothetical protein
MVSGRCRQMSITKFGESFFSFVIQFFCQYIALVVIVYVKVSAGEIIIIIIITFSISLCPLNPYGLQHHCEKQILFCIHGKSILRLGRLDA